MSKDNKIHKSVWGKFAIKLANGLSGDTMDFSGRDLASELSKSIIAMDTDGDGSLEWYEVWPAMQGWFAENL